MSFVKIWIHAVWETKNREKILKADFRYDLFKHIKDNASKNHIHIDFINGYLEHVHCLFTLNADISLSKTMQLIKGESSHWFNQNQIQHLRWADDYFASSVSESMIDKVRNYIKKQENHHKNVSFADEYNEFMNRYGFQHQG